MSGCHRAVPWAAHRNEVLVADRDRFAFTVMLSGSGM
jgi:hypothetical protein